MTLAALSGCSLVYWPSDALYTSGAEDAASSVDASDVGAARDGAADVSADGADASACPSQALFCDDFERMGVLGPFTQGMGTVSITSAHAHSPTRSLSARATNGGGTPFVGLQLALPSRATLSFWLYVPSVPPSADANFRVAGLLWGTSCDWDLALTVYVSSTAGLAMEASYYDAKMNTSCGPISTLPRTLLLPAQAFVSSWHHVVATFDVSTQERKIDAIIDGMQIPRVTLTSTRPTVPTSAALLVGIPCVNTTGGCFPWTGTDYEVLIDDVSLVAAP